MAGAREYVVKSFNSVGLRAALIQSVVQLLLETFEHVVFVHAANGE